MKPDILMHLGNFVLYGALLVFLAVKGKQGAAWMKKLSVRVTAVFAAVKALTSLFLVIATAAGCAEAVLSGVGSVLEWAGMIYIGAMLFLCLLYLGKSARGKK